jgi:glycosyltransferase involved in cell wall biosynthesis
VGEALSCGVPIVCFDRGGPPFLAGDAGVVVVPSTPNETVRRLAQVLEDASIPEPARAVERASAFTRDRLVLRLEELIGGVTAAR